MFCSSSLLFVAVLASVHSFTFVAATSDPQITQAPRDIERSQAPAPILSTITYAYSALPEQVYPYPVLRGPQSGYNLCNSTTEGSDSRCQTPIFNNLHDFCVWGSPIANGTIGDEEASVVAYCTQKGHGARVITPGSITGAQMTRTPAYIQITGFINNAGLDLDPTDSGGELDPHGADLQGNPLGGVVYSNGIQAGDDLIQVLNWNQFVGSGRFCFKACFNNVTNPNYCLNTFDLIGCDYNMPSDVSNGTFTSCDGDVQDVVGVYTTGGTTTTWSMPATLNGRPPYTPRVPASSNCQTFHSTDLFGVPTSTPLLSAKATGTGSLSSGSSGSRSGAAPSGTSTSSSLSSLGVPPAFYALGLGMMAGVALVL